jgi:hypothetical protein
MYNNIDNQQLTAARENTYWNDITNYNFEDVNPTDLKEFARECYKVLAQDVQSEVMGDFTLGYKVMPFQQDEWMYQFEEYLVALLEENMIQHLNEEYNSYEREACESLGVGTW